MFKICHITSSHSIDDVRIFKKECTSLADKGFDVTLIACGDIAFEDIKNGVKRISIIVPIINKLDRMIKRSKAIYKKSLEVDADVYHFHDIELFYYGLKLKNKGFKVIFDSHEDWPMYLSNVKWVPGIIKKIVVYSLNQLYKKHLNKFDAVITITPHVVDRLKRYTNKVYMITNYPIVDQNNLKYFSKEDYLLKENTIFYSGSVYSMSNQEAILQAISEIPNIQYNIAGKLLKSYEKELSKYPSWNKVKYLGYLGNEELNKAYLKSTIGIIIFDYNITVGFKLGTLGSNKLFEYMGYGLPIICSDFDLWNDMIIKKYKCGICVHPKNIDELQKAIQYLIDNKEAAYQMGQNAQKAVYEEFNWGIQANLLFNLYKILK